MEPTIIPAPENPSGPTIPGVGLEVTGPFGSGFGDISVFSSFFTSETFWGFWGSIWSAYTIAAYIFSIILLVLYVYSSTQKNLYVGLQTQMLRDAERLFAEQFLGAASNSRLRDVMAHVDSDSPNDWKLAIIEADIILDDVLKQRGYPGASLGERLKSVSPQQLGSLQDAWEAHKVRNRIAHEGADFVLTKRIAHETIGRYQRVFNEFGVT